MALALSTVFESCRWHWTGSVGLALTLALGVVAATGAAPPRPWAAAVALMPR